VRNFRRLPILTEKVILRWAQDHHRRTGAWPTENSGPVHGAPGEVWKNIDAALRQGTGSLRAGSSLARLLAARLGVRYPACAPPLTVEQILAWADAHYARTGRWPAVKSGAIAEAPGETWQAVETALVLGNRTLPGGFSLAQLLAKHRSVRNRAEPPKLTAEQVLAWADAHRERTGKWPSCRSGALTDGLGETWGAIHQALSQGLRGFPGGSSLARLLAEQRGKRNRGCLPKLTPEQIRAWAVAHRKRTGSWPTARSGPVPEAPGETWRGIEMALVQGHRDLPGGSSLARLLIPLKETLT
jgi:hypothetical protein